MISLVKNYSWAVLLLAATVPALAQESSLSKKSAAAVEKLLRTPAAVGKSLANLADATKGALEEANGAGQAAGVPAVVAAPPEVKTQSQEGQRFSPGNRRDPFRPFNLDVRPSARQRENLAPLERYELGQLKLVGVVWDKNEPKAMIEDSAGLGYVVKVGTPIGVNDGKVKAIKPNGIVIGEFYIDLYGTKKMRDVELRLSAEKLE